MNSNSFQASILVHTSSRERTQPDDRPLSTMSLFKMEFDRGFSYIFYFVGLHPRLNRSASKSRIFDIFPTVVYSIVVAMAVALSFYAQFQLSIFPVVVDTVATYLLICSECVLNFTVIVQMLLYRSNFKNLYRKYVAIQKYISSRVKQPIRFNEFLSTFGCLVATVLMPFVFTVSIRTTIMSTGANILLDAGLMVLQFAASLVQLHTIIHVSLLNFFYKCSTKWLNVRVPDVLTMHAYQTCESSEELQRANIAELRQIKFFHFKLWEISTNINRIFGWSIFAIIFRNYFEIFYSVLSIYWMHLYSLKENPGWILLRKSIIYIHSSIFQSSKTRL